MPKIKKRKKTVVQSLKGILQSVKENFVGAMIVAVMSFIGIGVLNALMADFFTSCSNVIQDGSKSILHAISDVLYLQMAKSNAMVMSNFAASILVTAFVEIPILMIFQLLILLRRRISELRENVVTKEKHKSDTIAEKLTTYEARYKKIRLSMVAFIPMSIFMIFYAVSIFFSHMHIKEFNLKLDLLRPVVSDQEYYGLRQKWVQMRSREDYDLLSKMLDEYEKRVQAVDKPCGNKSDALKR